MQTYALEAVTQRPSTARNPQWLKRLLVACVGIPLAVCLVLALGLGIAFSPTYAWRVLVYGDSKMTTGSDCRRGRSPMRRRRFASQPRRTPICRQGSRTSPITARDGSNASATSMRSFATRTRPHCW